MVSTSSSCGRDIATETSMPRILLSIGSGMLIFLDYDVSAMNRIGAALPLLPHVSHQSVSDIHTQAMMESEFHASLIVIPGYGCTHGSMPTMKLLWQQ